MKAATRPNLEGGQITAVGAVYDLIWQIELPPFRRDEPLDELVVRGVMMALASYLNHHQLRARKFHVYPSDELLGRQVSRSAKQVGRVLDYLVDRGLLVLVRKALGPGRGRAARPPIYSLPIDVWQQQPRRSIRASANGSDTGVQAMTGSTGQTPVINGSDTGVHKSNGLDTGGAMAWTPVSTEPGHLNPAIPVNPSIEPGHARARASGEPDRSRSFEITLPGLAVALTTPTPPPSKDSSCLDCGAPAFSVPPWSGRCGACWRRAEAV